MTPYVPYIDYAQDLQIMLQQRNLVTEFTEGRITIVNHQLDGNGDPIHNGLPTLGAFFSLTQ